MLLAALAACSPSGGPALTADPGTEEAEVEAEEPAGITEEEAIAIAEEQFDFEVLSTEVEAITDDGRNVWKVTLRGRPPGPEAPMGEYGEVWIHRETGEIVSIAQS